MASARIDGFSRPPEASSPLPRRRCRPRSSSMATSARQTEFTTALRTSVSAPSSSSGSARNTWSATTKPSTESPRNSSRSLDSVPGVLGAPGAVGERLGQQRLVVRGVPERVDETASAEQRRRDGRRSAAVDTAPRVPRQARDDVVDGVAHGLEVFEVLVLDAEPDLRSPISSSRASTSSMRASESASRSSTKLSPSLIDVGLDLQDVGEAVPDEGQDLVAVHRAAFHVGLCGHVRLLGS